MKIVSIVSILSVALLSGVEASPKPSDKDSEFWARAMLLDAAAFCDSPNNPLLNGLQELKGNKFSSVDSILRITEPGELIVQADVVSTATLNEPSLKEIRKGSISLTLHFWVPSRPESGIKACELKIVPQPAAVSQP